MRIKKRKTTGKPKPRYKLDQKVAILTKTLPFQEQIASLRRKWHIPQTGFAFTKEYKQWWDNLSQQTKQSEQSLEHQQALQDIKAHHITNFTRHSCLSYIAEYKHLQSQLPFTQFYLDLLDLRKKFHLSDYWAHFLEQYLEFNKVSTRKGYNTFIHIEHNPETKEQEVYLRIWEHTRIKDVKNIWSAVRLAQRTLPGFRGASRKSQPGILERDINIYQLHCQDEKPKDIADAINDKYGSLSAEEIRKVIERMEKKAGVTSKKLV